MLVLQLKDLKKRGKQAFVGLTFSFSISLINSLPRKAIKVGSSSENRVKSVRLLVGVGKANKRGMVAMCDVSLMRIVKI